ncbi:Dynein light chain 4, axonemal [Amphibalanus amphitrite]|uniref:Dynein light chain n=1 Tax=Amphibalanus amphitrite TaxID=1232801 RepID=A0A6A4VZQ4_AMPAM|nr:dynein axonemal light chain 4-like [Amphibalanus amphitrite]XP_043203146.1 dynein axonemal light chain 4-like [Amphibalanus amphitrite]XP_043233467.1 dynein axonemal light chain 4-like [Amphibalanus amphitrite]XP_043233468.1 dynein axonemal light chain 4-like [Amphibalanus amphitrite]KAF0296880.1 Dynein light chain 4, axonemal [Amphibalanus amphitrite]KAF0311865.1 Dynein light chain 4, axonemal [Amphibalanus amphitrite]
MADDGDAKKDEGEKKVVHTYPLCRQSDMPEEMRTEVMELCVTACEKYSSNNESAARMIKEAMDKKYGAPWHTVVGEAFGFEVSHECKHLLYMFFGGNMGICVWKCN